MKKISLKIKLTLKYTGCIFVATGIALFLATVISGTDAQSAKAMAKVVLPIVFIASLAIGYFLVMRGSETDCRSGRVSGGNL